MKDKTTLFKSVLYVSERLMPISRRKQICFDTHDKLENSCAFAELNYFVNIPTLHCTFDLTIKRGRRYHRKIFVKKKTKNGIRSLLFFFAAYVICKKNYSFSTVIFLFFSDQKCQMFLFKNK